MIYNLCVSVKESNFLFSASLNKVNNFFSKQTVAFLNSFLPFCLQKLQFSHCLETYDRHCSVITENVEYQVGEKVVLLKPNYKTCEFTVLESPGWFYFRQKIKMQDACE